MADSGKGSGATLGSDQGLVVDLQPLFQKLKPGPGLPADQVLADQRRRLQGAMIALVAEDGWRSVRVRSLARAAGVSTSTFYKHFLNADDCLASTYDAVMATALAHSAAAQRRGSDWGESLRATVAALMEDLAAEPRAASLALVDVFAGGINSRKRIGCAVGELERLLAASFAMAPREMTPPRHLVAGMTAGMLRIARTTTLTGRAAELPGFAEELGDWMLELPSPEVLTLSLPDSPTQGRREKLPFPADPARRNAGAPGNDRDRLLRAAIRLTSLEGIPTFTAPRLRAEAGVSRRSFDTFFGSVEECFLEAVEMMTAEAAGKARMWSEETAGWEHRTCRFLLALCAQAARNQSHARLAFQGILATGRAGLLRREHLVGQGAAVLRSTIPAECRCSSIAAEASVAAAWHIAQADLAAGRTRNLPSIAPLLSYVVLAPAIGARAASAAIQGEIGGRSP